ncbi:MAG TPA: TIGR03067 domain-containing protein [Gemmataceae bacterium]|nr:TIGR03067 domain-containing protein [Gemmataceae bacterium]
MRRAIWMAACVLVVGVASLGADEKESKFDASKLVGDWTYVSGMKGGEKVDPNNLKNKVVITKETLTLTGEQKFVMKYELDTSKKPVGIKLEMTESPFGAGAKAIGIIACNGKELKLCYDPDPEAKKAPEKFESTKENKAHLFVLKKAS